MIISVIIPDELAELIQSLVVMEPGELGDTQIEVNNLTKQDIDSLIDYGIIQLVTSYDGMEENYFITGLGRLLKDRI